MLGRTVPNVTLKTRVRDQSVGGPDAVFVESRQIVGRIE